MKKVDDQLVQELADQMKNMDPMLVRKMRAVTDEMKINPDMEGQVDDNEDKCEVRNLTCVKFPTRNQCSGIAMGGCMTRIQIMSMIFSPRVVLFLLVGIAGLTVAALFFSYFWYSFYSKKSLKFDDFLNLVRISENFSISGGTIMEIKPIKLDPKIRPPKSMLDQQLQKLQNLKAPMDLKRKPILIMSMNSHECIYLK